MTVREMIEQLQQQPQEAQVVYYLEGWLVPVSEMMLDICNEETVVRLDY